VASIGLNRTGLSFRLQGWKEAGQGDASSSSNTGKITRECIHSTHNGGLLHVTPRDACICTKHPVGRSSLNDRITDMGTIVRKGQRTG
jgi:hypothetical protein